MSGAGTGSGPDGKARVGTAAEETKWALENVKQILEQAGSGMDLVPSPPPHRPLARCDFLLETPAVLPQVLQVFCLVQDQKDYPEINEEYVKHWDILPARSTTAGFAGGAGKVGFGCIALVRDRS